IGGAVTYDGRVNHVRIAHGVQRHRDVAYAANAHRQRDRFGHGPAQPSICRSSVFQRTSLRDHMDLIVSAGVDAGAVVVHPAHAAPGGGDRTYGIESSTAQTHPTVFQGASTPWVPAKMQVVGADGQGDNDRTPASG